MSVENVQSVPRSGTFFQNLQKVLRQNIREYGMFIALFVIMAIFRFTTNGVFMSSRNLSNLLNQTGYIAVLAVGMTLVIVIRRGRDAASGNGYSRISIVLGSTLPTLLVPNSTKNTMPFEFTPMP